jgi:hypothetical protein
MFSNQSVLLGILWWQIACVMQVMFWCIFSESHLTPLSGTMADDVLRLFLISAAIVDAVNLVTCPKDSSTSQLLSVSLCHKLCFA